MPGGASGRPPLPLALTLGDPAGIGPEITLRAWLARAERRLAPFIAIGDPEHYRRLAQRLGLSVPIAEATPERAADLFATALPVFPLLLAAPVAPGHPDVRNAQATIGSIEQAVALTRAGRTAAIVTNPLAKHIVYGAGFAYPGQTEFLAALAAGIGEAPPHPVMMLWSETLAVVPVTVHVPFAEVPSHLTRELIAETARITARDLRERFGIARPRLAVAGLNPHAGENGTIGREERDVITPAIEMLRAEGLDIRGPLPADGMFHARARARYDVALAMYHDQALIPLKTLAFDDGVNTTLGLPFVRTSPDHGTAFDIAARGTALPDSLLAAIRLAARLSTADAARETAAA